MTPVEYYGQMQARGNKIIGATTKNPMQVKGMSFFWSHWSDKYWNQEYVDYMVDEYGCEVVRTAYSVWDDGVPCEGAYEDQVRRVVKAAIKSGVYVIVDWHSHGAENNTQEAFNFFQTMAKEFGAYDNVAFELYNEPIKTPWTTIKEYASVLIQEIRKYSDNLIIVGSPTWSQDVDLAANDPIDDENVAYTIHFYAGTHKQDLRDKANYALSKNIALVATEWGSVNADGDGGINYESTAEWMEWLDEKEISWCNWAINDKEETSSIFFKDGTLTEAGVYLKKLVSEGTKDAPWRK